MTTAKFSKGELLAILASVDIAVYFGDKMAEVKRLSNEEWLSLYNLNSARKKLVPMVGLTIEDVEGLTEAIMEEENEE